MSKNIKLNDTDYNGVSTVQLPTTDGGTATFKDTDEITTPSGDKNITTNGTYDVSAFARAIVNVASSGGTTGGNVVITEYDVVENADRSLWLNEMRLKLVKGVNILVNEKMLYNSNGVTLSQGAVVLLLMLWDGVAYETSIGVSSASSKSHLRAIDTISSQYSLMGATHGLESGNTTNSNVSEDGTLTLTTSATEVTTGNYNNDYIEVGKYYFIQIPSDTVC